MYLAVAEAKVPAVSCCVECLRSEEIHSTQVGLSTRHLRKHHRPVIYYTCYNLLLILVLLAVPAVTGNHKRVITAKALIAIAQRQFNRICQMVPTCTLIKVLWAPAASQQCSHQTASRSVQHFVRLSRFVHSQTDRHSNTSQTMLRQDMPASNTACRRCGEKAQ